MVYIVSELSKICTSRSIFDLVPPSVIPFTFRSAHSPNAARHLGAYNAHRHEIHLLGPVYSSRCKLHSFLFFIHLVFFHSLHNSYRMKQCISAQSYALLHSIFSYVMNEKTIERSLQREHSKRHPKRELRGIAEGGTKNQLRSANFTQPWYIRCKKKSIIFPFNFMQK